MYRPLEQWEASARGDGRSDLFSLGVILYRLLTGEFPFQASSIKELVGKILSTTPVSLKEHAPGIPEAVDRIVRKALEKDPAKRFQDGKEMSAALKNAMESVKAHKNKETTLGASIPGRFRF